MELQQISSCFERYNYKRGDNFICQITHIYDLSKFWITTKPRELDRFQKFLYRKYMSRSDELKMPQDKISCGAYCVVLSDGTFYRAKIVGFAQTYKMGLKSNQTQVQIFFIDHGMTGVKSCDDIYILEAAFAKPPTFAVRAALAGISPFESDTWSSLAVNRFKEMNNCEELEAVVVNSCSERLIVEICCRRSNPRAPFHEILFIEKLAQPFTKRSNTVEVKEICANNWGGRCNLKYAYLFPTHEMLEEGKVPCSPKKFNDLFPKQCQQAISYTKI